MNSNVKMDKSVLQVVGDVMVVIQTVLMDQTKKNVKITHVLQISSNAEMEYVSLVREGVMVLKTVLMDQMKKIVMITHVLQIGSNAKMDNVSIVAGDVMV